MYISSDDCLLIRYSQNYYKLPHALPVPGKQVKHRNHKKKKKKNDLMIIWPLWWIYGKNNSHQMSRQWELHSCTEYIYAVVLTIIILCWNIVKPGQLYVCTIYHVTVWPYNITEFFFSSFLNKLIRCYLVQGLL